MGAPNKQSARFFSRHDLLWSTLISAIFLIMARRLLALFPTGAFAGLNQRSVQMEMKKLALAIALALGTTLAFAGDDAKKAQPSATGDKATTSSPTPQRGEPAGSSVGDGAAGAFWTEHARGGYMTKDEAMKYKGADGKPMDFKKLDKNSDGRVSQSEWTTYHEAFAQKEGGPKEAGAAGPT
ncbi:MAG: hypothetical protein ACREV0_12250, partial [Burkholderiales bacterium]